MRLNPKLQRPIRVLLTVTIMSAVMSFGMCFVRIGFAPDFVSVWLGSWRVAFLIALPTAWAAPKIIDFLLKGISFE